MKRTNLLLIGFLGIGLAFTSCGYSEGITERQLWNNETKVDTEGYTFFKVAHAKAAYQLAQAEYALTQGVSGEAKTLAENLIATYEGMLPEIEELAAEKQVIVPDPGALVFSSDAEALEVSFNAEDYVSHVRTEQAEILNQFKRASRNTDKDLRSYTTEKLEAISDLYKLAGGE